MANSAAVKMDRNYPWSVLSTWSRGLDSFIDELQTETNRDRTSKIETMSPDCDILETDSNYIISIDMPGVKLEEIEIETSDEMLSVTAERKALSFAENVRSHCSERFNGKLKRNFSLPADADKIAIQANYEDGTLHLTVPKQEAKKPHKVKINAGKNIFSNNLELKQ